MDEKAEAEFMGEIMKLNRASRERHDRGECEGSPRCSFCLFSHSHAPDLYDV